MNSNTLELPAGLHVRPSNESDDVFLLELYQSTRTDLDLINAPDDFILELKKSQYTAQTQSYQEQFPNAMLFTLEYYGKRIGRAIVDFGHNEVFVVDISMIEEAQGKGLGSSVIRSFMHCSTQAGIPLRLSVLQQNTGAKALYSRLGFVFEEQIGLRDYLAYYPGGSTPQDSILSSMSAGSI